MIVNPYPRVTTDCTPGPAVNYGNWASATPINISAAIATSLGKPLDWWLRGPTGGAITNGFRKGGSSNLFTVSVMNPTDGQPADAGHQASQGEGSFSWTDGPGGNVSGTTNGLHQLDGPLGNGGGFRIAVPSCTQWPDYWLLKCWFWDFPARNILYRSYMNDAAGSNDDFYLSQYNYEAFSDPSMVEPWRSNRCLTLESTFAADTPGQTFTFESNKTPGQYYQSIAAVALYKARINKQAPRGIKQAS